MQHHQKYIRIAKPSRAIVDPWFSTVTDHQRGGDQRTVLAKPGRTTDGIKSELAARHSQKTGNNLRFSKSKSSYTESEARSQTRSWKPKRRRRGRKKTLLVEDKIFLPKEAHLEAFRSAGLPMRGLWTMSQRNRARLIGQSEPEPGTKRIS
ncbi:hypothetical protein AOQ84DRAFT_443368 [Glonium stellatum]|uniref:Uncharacterized protein n=1 Tax=Glonium stellatum TaxID=574774 RepID=A0A8E2EPL2_9PEZI|nr:hypothetical protein AOQ84DRAFT_443368 [Glonium stellatum]